MQIEKDVDNRIILDGIIVNEFTKNPFVHLTPRELLETFPEALSTIKRNIKILKGEIERLKEVCYPMFDLALDGIHAHKMDENQDFDIKIKKMWCSLAKSYFIDRDILPKENTLKFLKNLLVMSEWKGEENPIQIEKAKNVPLTYFIKEKIIKCPFHNEKTPSCNIYVDHYHCFGCGAHGDVIDFVMQSEGLNFKSAVARLCKI